MGGARTTAPGFADRLAGVGTVHTSTNLPHYAVITQCSHTLIPAQRARSLAGLPRVKTRHPFPGHSPKSAFTRQLRFDRPTNGIESTV
jgi:hypothetical protein